MPLPCISTEQKHRVHPSKFLPLQVACIPVGKTASEKFPRCQAELAAEDARVNHAVERIAEECGLMGERSWVGFSTPPGRCRQSHLRSRLTNHHSPDLEGVSSHRHACVAGLWCKQASGNAVTDMRASPVAASRGSIGPFEVKHDRPTCKQQSVHGNHPCS